MFNLELLLPVGSIENFFAAIRGGADAVYLGLKNFNARKKAKNFSYTEVFNLVREAHKNNVKVFITINTLIKNSEISELIKTLEIVSQIKPDAIIIQDFAIANLVKKYFNNIKIHASTQLASHNSADCVFFKKQGFERVILARELTENELISISKNSDIQKEIFVHGALCYSFSGHCLFSSFLGGNSANRGMCTQVCRRNFISENQKEPFFSLKDLQLINNIPLFSKLKINSLKIEGRMKSPEYVYVTSKAYRNAIDNFDMIEKSEEQLEQDFGREKTDFFFGKNISESISENPSTGIFLGKIFKLNSNSFQIISNIDLTKTSKLRVRIFSDTETEYIKIQKIEKNQNNKYTIYCNTDNLIENIEIFHVGNIINTTNSFTNYIDKKFQYLPDSQIKAIVNSFKIEKKINSEIKYFLRISNLENINDIDFQKFSAVFLKFQFHDLKFFLNNISNTVNCFSPYGAKHNNGFSPRGAKRNNLKSKIVIELPKFISELEIQNYKNILRQLSDNKFNVFSISHLSQIEILPQKSKIFSNENIYLLNDLSVNFAKNNGVSEYIYPYENDYPNLISGRDRNGIVPIYFYPELFFSRVPVKVGEELKDEEKNAYKKINFNGFTIIIDKNPVSLTHFSNKLIGKGFTKFLFDFSYKENYQEIENVLEFFKTAKRIQNSKEFNMKKCLK